MNIAPSTVIVNASSQSKFMNRKALIVDISGFELVLKSSQSAHFPSVQSISQTLYSAWRHIYLAGLMN